jgi:hypothetical protein
VQTDIELFRAITENLYTAVLGDVLDVLGHTHQFLPQPIQPMKESMRLVGRAMPVQIADTWSQQKDPFGLMTEALDQLLPGEVYVATGGSQNCAAWGEILTATARVRGAVGAVIDGYHRDTVRILEQNWACIQPWPLCAGRRRPFEDRGLSMPGRNWGSTHHTRRLDFCRHGRRSGCATRHRRRSRRARARKGSRREGSTESNRGWLFKHRSVSQVWDPLKHVTSASN